MSDYLRKIRPSFFLGLLAAVAIAGTIVIACDDTGPSPIGQHFDDASVEPDTSTPPDDDAGDEAGDDGGDEAATDDGGEDAGDDAADAADAADAEAH